jgi:hypothetical protein
MSYRNLIICLLVSASLLCAPTHARAEDSKESLVKAAFIVNFIKFVEWPAPRSVDTQSSIDICVIGDSELIKTSSIFKQGSSDKLKLLLMSEPNIENVAKNCHVAFISGSHEGELPTILSVLRSKPVLTVSDISNVAERGGMIGFVISDNKIRLEINKRSIEAAGLKINPKLLQIALKVIDK